MDVQEFNRLLKLIDTDEEARLIFCRYCLKCVKFCLSKTNVEPERVEEIAHEIIVKILEKPPKFVFAPCKYIARAIKNHLTNYYIKLSRERKNTTSTPFENLDVPGAEVEIPEEDDDDGKYKLLEGCTQTDIDIIILHVVDGYSEKEIAKMLGMNYAAVRARYSRAIRKLNKNYKNRHK